MTPVAIRTDLVHALRLDLIGPEPGSPLADEVLPQSPSRWYLTGFLVPREAAPDQRAAETADEPDLFDERGATDDAGAPEPAAARRAFFPSSVGLSLLVPGKAKQLVATVTWGDYRRDYRSPAPVESDEEAEVEQATEDELAQAGQDLFGDQGEPGRPSRRAVRVWKRTDRRETVPLALPDKDEPPVEFEVPDSDGLRLVLAVRSVRSVGLTEKLVPKGTRSVSVFLVNQRRPAPDASRDEGWAFQAQLRVECDQPLVPRPNLRGLDSQEWDEQVADLQYRDACEFAVGHNAATHAEVDAAGACRAVRTCWIPTAEVEHVAPATLEGVELGMEQLAALASGVEARDKVAGLVSRYRDWIAAQSAHLPADLTKQREATARELLNRATIAANRIDAGIRLLEDGVAREAFCLANKVMARAARQREAVRQGKTPSEVDPPRWRPFQLAFVLMNLPGLGDPRHADREVVDLLFFPTGGGKTEAYLGLAAFTLLLRRLRHPGIGSAGLSVLMRYTLRLLTLDQLSRAATLVCALELERQGAADRLGDWPFEIGLWVGRAATPNLMGKRGDGDQTSARHRTIAFKNDDRKPSPIPLENCPWCGEKFTRNSFQLRPNPDHPTDLRVVCVNRHCDFSGERSLPVLAVDEPIYRRLPCFLIATVDKFAAMPWTGEVGAFFGRVERWDEGGFYGPCHPGRGRPLPGEGGLPPPDLVIQDELHLISGPMGTMVGLYEAALDELCARGADAARARPKVVASTATVRRAERQIQSLFNRRQVDIFPPPGTDRRDSFFARTHTPEQSNARLYVGVAAQGRSLKVVLLRVYLALMAAAQKAWLAEGGARNRDNAADAYMTLLGYFNSLRELGGSRRIVEDEVGTRLSGYGRRKRVGEQEGLFAPRKIAYEVLELTSRVGTDRVADAKRRLALRFHEKEHVDVAIATNMISVGLDITRLGLMVVLGQPKTSAEYIQATSRVGRDTAKGPGLVVSLLNVHRPRDRSHYERFAAYHQTFYRSVEATSVTPFSPRALDRGLAGAAVALARLAVPCLTPPKGASEILAERGRLTFVADLIADRGAAMAPKEEQARVRSALRYRVADLLDEWEKIATEYRNQGVELQYQQEVGAAQRLLYEFLNPELRTKPRHAKFRANRSMRDVEPGVNLWARTLDGIDLAGDDE